MNNLNFEEFKAWLQENIKTYLPQEYADAEITFRNVEKLSRSYTGMLVHIDGQKISPLLDTDQFYAAYQKGIVPEQILADMAAQIKKETIFETDWLSDYSMVRERLFTRVSNAEKNAGILKNVPHKTMEDLALTYHVEVALSREDMASVMINDTMLSEYGISVEQLHEDALNNSQAVLPATMDSMRNILAEMLPPEFQSDLPETEGIGDLMVLTNTTRLHGAATLFYPGIMDEVAEEMQGDYFILPSSTHEVLILPADAAMDYRELEAMVQGVNAAEVEPEDQLSDRVYHYSAKEHRFERADHYEERLKEEQKKALAQKPERKKPIHRNRL